MFYLYGYEVYLFVMGVALIASFVQSATGFGYAVICMALWPLVMPFRTASILEALTAFVLVTLVLARLWHSINWKILWPPLVASIITGTFGVLALMSSSDTVMRRIVGAVLLLLCGYFVFFSDRVHIKPTVLNGMIAGAVSGFFGGWFNIAGPPMAIYFLAVIKNKEEYNATIQFHFGVNTIFCFIIHLVLRNVGAEIYSLGLAVSAAIFVGTFFGMKLFSKLKLKSLKRVVYIFMAAMGTYMLIVG
ncbi:MAG: sulfite exporter TauE/SafE family protein [Oscillospiraceae bacterium]